VVLSSGRSHQHLASVVGPGPRQGVTGRDEHSAGMIGLDEMTDLGVTSCEVPAEAAIFRRV
jgi:hypothetical protein